MGYSFGENAVEETFGIFFMGYSCGGNVVEETFGIFLWDIHVEGM